MWGPIPAVAILLAAAPPSLLGAGFELAQMGSSRVDYSRAYCVSFTEKGESRPFIAQRCMPGTTFKLGCNRCLCRQSGNSAICTKKNCLQRMHGGECELGMINTVECNVCICSRAGRWACTQRQCRPGIRYVPCDRDMTETAYAGTGPMQCKPGTSFMNGCDRCYCANDGVSAICRYRPCNGVTGILVPLGAVSGGSEHESPDCGHGEGQVFQNGTHICSICALIILCFQLQIQDGIQGPPGAVSGGSENESLDCGHGEGQVFHNGTHICSICGPITLCYELLPQDGAVSDGSGSDNLDCCHGEGTIFENGTHICFTSATVTLCYELPPQDGAVLDGSGSEYLDCGHGGGTIFENGTHICFVCETMTLCYELPRQDGRSSRHQEYSASTKLTNAEGMSKVIRGVSCKPGTTFMDKCNVCLCLPDGKSAACTFKHCPPGIY